MEDKAIKTQQVSGIQGELSKLLSNLAQEGAIFAVSGGRLLISPPEVAERYRDEIVRLKPEILIFHGHCPICTAELVITRIESFLGTGIPRKYSYCPKGWHFEKWEKPEVGQPKTSPAPNLAQDDRV